MKINNLIAATYAPLDDKGGLNLEVISTYQDYLISNKVSGAFVNGSTGDFASLSVEERKAIIDAWANIKSDDFKLINHVGHTSLKIAKELTVHSADKVDAISTLSPFYFKPPTLESLVNYCGEIAACAPNLPFYYYHIPVLTGANFNMVDFLELASIEIPNLAGIKFTKNDLVEYRYSKNFNNEQYNILFGVDELFLSSLPLGGSGWVGSTYNHLAPLYYKIKEAFEQGDMQLAAELQTKAVLFVDTLNKRGGFNGAAKSFMKIIGVDCGVSRYPHVTLLKSDLEEVSKELELLGISKFLGTLK